MAIAVHIVNKPNPETRQQAESVYARLDELDARHPEGRFSHIAWVVGDEFHVLDVWESKEKLDAFFGTLGPVLDEFGMELAGQPEIGDVVQIILSADRTGVTS